MRLPHWSFKEFVGTVNTTGLSSVVNVFLWAATGLWTLHVMEWATVHAPTTSLSLLRVGALIALLPFHAAWCGYLTARSGINVVQRAVQRTTDIDYVKAKGEVETARAAAVANGAGSQPKPAAPASESEPNGPEWVEDPNRGVL